MKKLLMRFSMLFVLVMTGVLGYFDAPAFGAFDCGMAAYNKWSGCDSAYSTTLYTYHTRVNYCDNNASTVCSAIAHNYCHQQATGACQGNSNPSCYNSSYNGCYMSQYQSCHTQTNAQCHDNVGNAYNNRGNAYGSCLGIEGNYGNCIEQLDGECTTARGRAQACNDLYPGLENMEARATCILNSGVDRCE